nr:MAG TPA: Lipopolysaccharide assembly protein A domain [Caudoviricetes sp.]
MQQKVKNKIMKSKLKYYAQVIGVNLLAFLVPVLAVVLIYGLGKLKNIYSHPCVLSQEIYDCCLGATIVVLACFSVGLLLLGWADSWRKAKLFVLKSRKEREEREERELLHIKMEVEPIEERTEQKNTPALGDSEFEDISELTVKEIYHLYHGRQVLITAGKAKGNFLGRLAGYDNEGSILYIGFTQSCLGPYTLDGINVMRDTNPEVSYVEPGYKGYDCYIPSLIRIHK